MLFENPFLNDLCSIFVMVSFAQLCSVNRHWKSSDCTKTAEISLVFSGRCNQRTLIVTFRFLVLLPFPLVLPIIFYVAHHHWSHLHKFQSPVSEDIHHNIYVDNIISGCNSEAQLVQYYTQARGIMNQANFNLRSWASNSTTLQQIFTADKTI